MDICKYFPTNDLSIMAGMVKFYFFDDSVNVKSNFLQVPVTIHDSVFVINLNFTANGEKADIWAVLCYCYDCAIYIE